MSTIFAVSSGRPPAAIAVLRISGPDAPAAGRALAGTLPPPRRAGLRLLRDEAGVPLDRAVVLVFPGPASATGEDCVELHCHGGRAVVDAVERALAGRPGCRAAEPGEFTRRALANGRIDLAEAEGLADLLEAETEAQRVAALAAAEGRISLQVGRWMTQVADLSARIEAMLDHSDEDDVEDDAAVLATIVADATALGRVLAAAAGQPPVERLRDGLRIVIAGPPNAGKSTLLNLMVEREAAIVSPVAGTTRDRIEANVVRGGTAYTLLDTAGLTATDDVVEAIGVALARDTIASADLLLWLGEDEPPMADALWIQSRGDIADRKMLRAGRTLRVSAYQPESIAQLWEAIAARAARLAPRVDALPMSRRHLRSCADAAEALMTVPNDPLLVGEHLRQARVLLATIVGANATDAMLDALLSRFCLGK